MFWGCVFFPHPQGKIESYEPYANTAVSIYALVIKLWLINLATSCYILISYLSRCQMGP